MTAQGIFHFLPALTVPSDTTLTRCGAFGHFSVISCVVLCDVELICLQGVELKLQQVRASAAGVYNCRVWNTVGKVVRSIDLKIKCK